jgi:tetratricopeptide (TPR) repeat protein/V8-like Glu-specific endopeptidase
MNFPIAKYTSAIILPAIVTQMVTIAPTHAKSASEISQIAKNITVLIEGELSPGSGTIVQKDGDLYTILTAKHVVRNRNQTLTIITVDGTRHQLVPNSIKILQNVDLATVQFRSSTSYQVAKLGDSDRILEGSNIYVAGFPVATAAITRSIYNFTDGKLTANASQPLSEGYALVYSNNTLPGMSGGPVFNEAGETIAIHGRGDTAAVSESASAINPNVRVKTGFNLGIPIKTFLQNANALGYRSGDRIASNPPVATPPPVRNRPPRADDAILAAAESYNRGDINSTIRSLDRAISINPQSADIYTMRGNLYYSLGNTANAKRDYETAVKIAPQSALPWSYLCLIYGDEGRVAEAIQAGDRAVAADPKLALGYNNRGLAYFHRGSLPQSRADFDRAISLDPNFALAYSNRGYIKANQNDLDGALQDYNIAIRLDSRLALAYSNRGLLYYQRQQTNRALQDFSRAISLNPNLALARHNRGALLVELRRYQEALPDLNRAIELNPQLALAYAYRGIAYISLGDENRGNADIAIARRLASQQGNRINYQTQTIFDRNNVLNPNPTPRN